MMNVIKIFMTGFIVCPDNIFFCSIIGNDTIYIKKKRLAVIHREINYAVYRQQRQIEI